MCLSVILVRDVLVYGVLVLLSVIKVVVVFGIV